MGGRETSSRYLKNSSGRSKEKRSASAIKKHNSILEEDPPPAGRRAERDEYAKKRSRELNTTRKGLEKVILISHTASLSKEKGPAWRIRGRTIGI